MILLWEDGRVFCTGRRDQRVNKEAKMVFFSLSQRATCCPHFVTSLVIGLRHLTRPGQWTGKGRNDSTARKSQWDSSMSLLPCHWPWMLHGPDHAATRCMPSHEWDTALWDSLMRAHSFILRVEIRLRRQIHLWEGMQIALSETKSDYFLKSGFVPERTVDVFKGGEKSRQTTGEETQKRSWMLDGELGHMLPV